jgi:hypothetical protein
MHPFLVPVVALVAACFGTAQCQSIPTTGLVSRWVADNGKTSVGAPAQNGDGIASVPDSKSTNSLSSGSAAPRMVAYARGCHSAMQFWRTDVRLSTTDSTNSLDPKTGEWLFYAVGIQDAAVPGSVVSRESSFVGYSLRKALAFTVSAGLVLSDTLSGDYSGASKAGDVLNTWQTWMIHITRDSSKGYVTYYENNDDSKTSAGGISGYSNNDFIGGVSTPGVAFNLGGSTTSPSFSGQLLEAGIYKATGINRTTLQTYLEQQYYLACPPIAPTGSALASRTITPAVSGSQGMCGQAGSPSPRDGATCTQGCASGASRVAGFTTHTCGTGAWSGSPIVCEGTCPPLKAPSSTNLCYQVALSLAFDESGGVPGSAGLNQGVLRQLIVSPSLPADQLSALWSVDTTNYRIVTNSTSSCNPSAYPTMLYHSNPLWTSVLSAASAVNIDATLAFVASPAGTGSLGVATNIRDANNYYYLQVTLNYPLGNPGTNPATATNASVQLFSKVQGQSPAQLLSGVVTATSFSGTQPLRARLWVQQGTLNVYVGPVSWVRSPGVEPSVVYGYGPRAGGDSSSSSIVSPIDPNGQGSVPPQGSPVPGFSGWSPFYGSTVNLANSQNTAGLWASGSGWFDNVVISTDCQAGRSCQFGSSSMQCVHGCSPGYRLVNGSAVRHCVAGTTGSSLGAWTEPEIVCAPVPPGGPGTIGPFSVPEGAASDTPVGTPLSEFIFTNATDVSLLFSIEGPSNIVEGLPVFKIASCSGQIYVDNGGGVILNYENTPSFRLTVRATPNGDAAASSTFFVDISVTNVDEAPSLESPTNRTIIESAAAGTFIGSPLVWSDPDCAAGDLPCLEQQTPVFTIESGSPASWAVGGQSGQPLFVFGNSSFPGQLMVGPGGGLDFESVSIYTLLVRAASPADSKLFSTAVVTIYVSDGPDPPTVPSPQGPFTQQPSQVVANQRIGGIGPGALRCGNASADAGLANSFFACDVDGGALTYSVVSVFNLLTNAVAPTSLVTVGSTTGTMSWGASGLPTNLLTAPIQRIGGYSVVFALRVTIRVTDPTSLSAQGDAQIYVVANASVNQPQVDNLFIINSFGTVQTAPPPTTGTGYFLVFTGSNLGFPSVLRMAPSTCRLPAATFPTAQVLNLDVANCKNVSSTRVECPLPAGAGTGLECSLYFLPVGGGSAVQAFMNGVLSYSYQGPSLTYTYPRWDTLGGQDYSIPGNNFGTDKNIVTVFVGSYQYTSTPASQAYQFGCTVKSVTNTQILITVPETYGVRAHFKISVGGNVYSGFSPYAYINPPQITSFSSYFSSGDPQNLETGTSTYVLINGKNFGPYLQAGSSVALRPTGCLSRLAYSYQIGCTESGTEAITVCYKYSGTLAHSRMICLMPPWAGKLLSAQICIIGPDSNKYCGYGSVYSSPIYPIADKTNSVSYRQPDVRSVTGPTDANTAGGDLVTIQAFGTGPVGFDLVGATYGPVGYEKNWISAVSCQVTRASTSTSVGTIECNLAPMPPSTTLPIATGHSWALSIGNQVSSNTGCCTSYGPPILSAISGVGASSASTQGGQLVILTGKNFGPAPGPVQVFYYLDLSDDVNDSGVTVNGSSAVIPIGDGSGQFKIQPWGGSQSCTVTVAHQEVQCLTAPAAGAGLRWEVVAYNRSSVPPATFYGAPVITNVTTVGGQPLSNANPLGGTVMLLLGSNFGPPTPPYGQPFQAGNFTGPLVEWVRYGSGDVWRPATNVTVLSHSVIRAVLGPGIGSDQTVVVSVAGQQSSRLAVSAQFDFDPPVLLGITPSTGPPVPQNAISGNDADAFIVRGTATKVPNGYSMQVLFGNPSDSSQVQPPIPASVTFGPASNGVRNASFQFALPAGAGLRRYVQMQVFDPSNPAAPPVLVKGSCAFDYSSPVIRTFQLRKVPPSETLPPPVLLNFPYRAADAYQVTLVGSSLSNPSLDAAPGSTVVRVVEVQINGNWYSAQTLEGSQKLYVTSQTDTQVDLYLDIPFSAPTVNLRLRITGQAASNGPASRTCSSSNPSGTSVNVEQIAPVIVSLERPSVSGLVGTPPGGYPTAGGALVQVQVTPIELLKASELSIVVADVTTTNQLNCPVAAIIASNGNWGANTYVPGTTPTWTKTQVVANVKQQCATFYGLQNPNDIIGLPVGDNCQIFCVSPAGQGDSSVIAFVTDDSDNAIGGSVAFPFAVPTLLTASVGDSQAGVAPVFGAAVSVNLTAPGQSQANALQVQSDGTSYVRLSGSNFGVCPQVWFFRDSPSLDPIDSYVVTCNDVGTYQYQSFSQSTIVVRIPRGWGTSRAIYVRAPPGASQVSSSPAYFNYRVSSVSSACVWNPTAGQCQAGAMLRPGSQLQLTFSQLEQPLELSAGAANQFVPISVAIRSSAPTGPLSGLTAGQFCGKQSVDSDGHQPVACTIGSAPVQDENGNACPNQAAFAVVAQSVPTTALGMSSGKLYCTIGVGAGQNMEVQVAVGPRASVVFGATDAGVKISFTPPVVTKAYTLSYDQYQFASDASSVLAAMQTGSSPLVLPPSARISSQWPGGNLTGPTMGGYIMVLEGYGFGRNYAASSASFLAGKAKTRQPVPLSAFVGNPPSIPVKGSCLFASPWLDTRTPGGTTITPTCDGAETYQAENEGADATFLSNPLSGWKGAMLPTGETDVSTPIILGWTDTAIAVRVPPGVGYMRFAVLARGTLNTVASQPTFYYQRPVVNAIRAMVPAASVTTGSGAAASATSLSDFFVFPSAWASDLITSYQVLPLVNASGAVSTDGEQVVWIEGSNFGPSPPNSNSYVFMPPANTTNPNPVPLSRRFPAMVVRVRASDGCATSFYEWDARGTKATKLFEAPPSLAPYPGVDCNTRTSLPLSVAPGRIIPGFINVQALSVLYHDHSAIALRMPAGVGFGRSLVVSVHSYETPETASTTVPVAESDAMLYSYKPPILQQLADPDMRITDASTASTPLIVFGSTMGREEDQPLNPANFPASSVQYKNSIKQLADGGWNQGGPVRTMATGSLNVFINGQQCLSAPLRLSMQSTTVTNTVSGAFGITSAVQCTTVNTTQLPVGPAMVQVSASGLASTMDNSSTLFVGCAPNYYGAIGQTCRPCPTGATCLGMASRSNHTRPVSIAGYYDLGRDATNIINEETKAKVAPSTWLQGVCPSQQPAGDVARLVCVVPCFPPEACLGDNVCSLGYASLPNTLVTSTEGIPSTNKFRCAYCAEGFYRRTTACERCPDQPILLVLAFLAAVALAAGLGLYLSSRQINVALLNTGVDTFQVLSLFTTARIRWPDAVRTLFELLSAFSLNIEITAPECLVPSLSFETKWWMVMLVPILTFLALFLVFIGYAAFKRFIKGQRGRRKFLSHLPKLLSAFLVALYFYYVLVTRKVMDVFDCEPVPNAGDDALYMASGTLDKCGEPGGLQLRLEPWGIVFLTIYTVGFPVVLFVVMFKYRFLIAMDQLLRAKGMGWDRASNTAEGYQLRKILSRMYFAYKPYYAWFWIQAILLRKLGISVTAVLFDNDSSFILTSMALVLIICYAVHVRNLPFMSPGDRPAVLREHSRHVMEDEQTAVRLQKVVESIEVRQKKSTRKMDWGDPARMGTGMSTSRRAALTLAGSMLVDYNVVEGTMLFCTILVSLCGILFNTERFEGIAYSGQRDFITFCVLLIIFGSLLYFVVVFIVDMHAGMQDAAVRKGKLRPEDVRPPCHACLVAAGCSTLPPAGKVIKLNTKEAAAERRAIESALADMGEEGSVSDRGIEMAAATAAKRLEPAEIQASLNPLFGIQGGSASVAASAKPLDAALDSDGAKESPAVPADEMSDLKRMTASILSMTNPPSSSAWPDIQQLFADLTSQLESHTKRARINAKTAEARIEESAARSARKRLAGGKRQFGQSRVGGSSRAVGSVSPSLSKVRLVKGESPAATEASPVAEDEE